MASCQLHIWSPDCALKSLESFGCVRRNGSDSSSPCGTWSCRPSWPCHYQFVDPAGCRARWVRCGGWSTSHWSTPKRCLPCSWGRRRWTGRTWRAPCPCSRRRPCSPPGTSPSRCSRNILPVESNYCPKGKAFKKKNLEKTWTYRVYQKRYFHFKTIKNIQKKRINNQLFKMTISQSLQIMILHILYYGFRVNLVSPWLSLL